MTIKISLCLYTVWVLWPFERICAGGLFDYMTTVRPPAPKPRAVNAAAKRLRSASRRITMVTMASCAQRTAMVTMAKCLQRFKQHGYGDY